MPTLINVTGTGGQATFDLGEGRPGRRSVLRAVASFQLSETVITVQEWNQVRQGASGYTLPPGQGNGPLFPVVATWRQAAAWCNALAEQDGVDPRYYLGQGGVYRGGPAAHVTADAAVTNTRRLPREVEWEYAAREGGTRPGQEWSGVHAGSGRVESDYANLRHHYSATYILDVNGRRIGREWVGGNEPTIIRASAGQPNGLGFYQMSGNVLEWCEGAVENPRDEYDDERGSAHYRILRGGSALDPSGGMKPSDREVAHWHMPELRNTGFRIAA